MKTLADGIYLISADHNFLKMSENLKLEHLKIIHLKYELTFTLIYVDNRRILELEVRV